MKLIYAIQAGITWKECAELPIRFIDIKATVIKGKVYYRVGNSHGRDLYIVHCYDPSQDKWTTLPPLPVRWFGLGQVKGNLVAVGGRKKSDKLVSVRVTMRSKDDTTNDVYVYDESSREWKKTIPPMPTARYFPSVLSLQSALVVAGGNTPSYTAVVEIFKPDASDSQWYRTDPLPSGCRDVSLVAIGNSCYALGGYKTPSSLSQALCASADELLHNAVPANQTTRSDSCDTRSAWKTLPNTSTYRPAAAVLAGNLLAIGGEESSRGGADMKEVYTYSPSTNSWIYISDLPAPRSIITVAVLSSTEILVIGGWNSGRANTVYKGTLHLKDKKIISYKIIHVIKGKIKCNTDYFDSILKFD